jgi:hypothetical protein
LQLIKGKQYVVTMKRDDNASQHILSMINGYHWGTQEEISKMVNVVIMQGTGECVVKTQKRRGIPVGATLWMQYQHDFDWDDYIIALCVEAVDHITQISNLSDRYQVLFEEVPLTLMRLMLSNTPVKELVQRYGPNGRMGAFSNDAIQASGPAEIDGY